MKNENKDRSPAKLFAKVFAIAVVIGLIFCGVGFSMLRNKSEEMPSNNGASVKNPISFVADLMNKEKDLWRFSAWTAMKRGRMLFL